MTNKEMNNNLIKYYAKRAEEYDRIYHRPERQNDLKTLSRMLGEHFRNSNVLEIACGTGYWTQHIAQTAGSITATDYNKEVIDIARQKNYRNCKVSFEQADAYSLSNISITFSSGFLGFWLSHIPKNKLDGFIKVFHTKLQPGAMVVVIDNKYVEGNSTPTLRNDEEGNTYQLRTLDDGSQHEVLKNFQKEDQLKNIFGEYAKDFEFVDLTYFWLLKYNTL
jgi:demethylmenaquinone methyltransferase/2-methoxy-6-polyprenyl-1,4-benzoquinol methylase